MHLKDYILDNTAVCPVEWWDRFLKTFNFCFVGVTTIGNLTEWTNPNGHYYVSNIHVHSVDVWAGKFLKYLLSGSQKKESSNYHWCTMVVNLVIEYDQIFFTIDHLERQRGFCEGVTGCFA